MRTYETVSVPMNLNDPNPHFKVTPLSDAEYLRKGTTQETQLQ